MHITGGGFPENIPRVVPKGLGTKIFRSSWDIPPVFQWIQQTGGIDDDEMFRTFNMGVGLVAVVSRSDVDTALDANADLFVLGEIVEGAGVMMT